MDKETAQLLVESLLERAEESSGKLFLTSIEIDAISLLFNNKKFTNPSSQLLQQSADKEVLFDFTSNEIPDGFMMCLDFGTSFSKAFAHEFTDTKKSVIDLKISSEQNGGSELLLPSELFIDGSEIYFGVAARNRFDDIEAEQDRLIDSPKQYLTLGSDVSQLGEIDLPQASKKDPNNRLKRRDALVLYLAHLNLKSEQALEKQNYSSNVRRRYTHPAWSDDINEKNKKEMRRILAEAILISRSFPGLVDEKSELNLIVPILSKAKSLEDAELDTIFPIIDEAVREATAAGSGALLSTEPGERDSFVVVDIGAGTTDVAGCYCVHHGATGALSTSEETTAAKAIRQAGNTLDNGLLKLILSKVHYDASSTEYHITRNHLQKKKRNYKELLFSNGKVSIKLPDDSVLNVTLDEYLQQDTTKRFVSELTGLITAAAKKVFNNKTVYLVPTGGGARLPFLAQIVQDIYKGPDSLSMEIKEAMPVELQETNPDLIQAYPQLAVSVGGSMPDLPIQKTNIRGGIMDPGKRVIEGSYKK